MLLQHAPANHSWQRLSLQGVWHTQWSHLCTQSLGPGRKDLEAPAAHSSRQSLLRALPKKVIVEMGRPLNKEYPGLPTNHFLLSPVTVYWLLDTEGDIQIARKGVPVRNVSTTVDGATGKTLETSIPDLGSWQLPPTFTRIMILYFPIILSKP